MKKITKFSIVVACILAMLSGCGDNSTNVQGETPIMKENITKNFEVNSNKFTVYINGKEEEITDSEITTLIKNSLSGMSKVENYSDEEGAYMINLYESDKIEYELSLVGNEIRLVDGNDKYIAYLTDANTNKIVDEITNISK